MEFGLFELSILLEYNDSEPEEQEALRLIACSYQEMRRLQAWHALWHLLWPQGLALVTLVSYLRAK